MAAPSWPIPELLQNPLFEDIGKGRVSESARRRGEEARQRINELENRQVGEGSSCDCSNPFEDAEA